MRARQRLAVVLAAVGAALVALTVAVAAANPVVAALRKTSLAHSSVGRLSAVSNVPGVGTTTIAGKLEAQGNTAHVVMTVSSGSLHYPMEATVLVEQGDLVLYLRSPLLKSQLPAGKKWVRIDLQKEGAKLGIDFSSLLGSPTAQSTRIVELGVVKTTSLGHATVAGRATSHYRLRVDYDLAARRAPALRPIIAKIEQLAGATSLKVNQDVWVGSDGRVRQLRYTQPAVSNGIHSTTTQTITFLAYNVPVKIAAPPASLVYSP